MDTQQSTRETRGQRIARLREARGWSPFDLQMQSGVREGNIRNYESGRRAPRDAELLKPIAEALGVTVDYLLEVPCDLNSIHDARQNGTDVLDSHGKTVAGARA